MTTSNQVFTTTDTVNSSKRQIRFWGSVARLVVGLAMIIAAVIMGIDRLDLVVGLLVFPAVEVVVLAWRGLNAKPLHMYGSLGHCLNWAIGIAAFSLLPVAALLFYGSSILLAFVRGYGGCEIFAISNWLRGRDDQIVCPLFSPIDQAEAQRAGATSDC